MYRSAIEGFELPEAIMDPYSRAALRLSGEVVFQTLHIPRILYVRAMRLPTAVWLELLLALRHGVAICRWTREYREQQLDDALFWHPRRRRLPAPYGSGWERRVFRRAPLRGPPSPP